MQAASLHTAFHALPVVKHTQIPIISSSPEYETKCSLVGIIEKNILYFQIFVYVTYVSNLSSKGIDTGTSAAPKSTCWKQAQLRPPGLPPGPWAKAPSPAAQICISKPRSPSSSSTATTGGIQQCSCLLSLPEARARTSQASLLTAGAPCPPEPSPPLSQCPKLTDGIRFVEWTQLLLISIQGAIKGS